MGTHKPVRTKAEKTPRAASIPNERRAGISETRLAEKAAIVVIDVSKIARPTRLTDIAAELLQSNPFFLSSL